MSINHIIKIRGVLLRRSYSEVLPIDFEVLYIYIYIYIYNIKIEEEDHKIEQEPPN
jgi:hypothetical protein